MIKHAYFSCLPVLLVYQVDILVVQQHCFILGWRELHILAGVYKLALHVAVSRSALYRIIVFPHRRTPRSA